MIYAKIGYRVHGGELIATDWYLFDRELVTPQGFVVGYNAASRAVRAELIAVSTDKPREGYRTLEFIDGT